MRKLLPGVCFAALIALFLLHNDFWLWNDARLIAGMPVGLLYHILFCVAASVVMYGLVRYAWPSSLEVEDRGENEL
jgi:hypothetical protein